MGDTKIIQYLVDMGADLGAYDLGKKNDGAFGASVEPLMPIDYAIGVGTFVPNNAVVIHEDAVALMQTLMKERGIVHTTSECTLRGFTCSQANVDPKVASPAEIQTMRKLAVGHQIKGLTGGLEVKERSRRSSARSVAPSQASVSRSAVTDAGGTCARTTFPWPRRRARRARRLRDDRSCCARGGRPP
jgi:hypothetical protein